MSEISDKIEELIFLKRKKGCELGGFADWSFKIGRFKFEKFKNLRKRHISYYIFSSGKKIYDEFQTPYNGSSIDFYCLDEKKMEIIIIQTIDKEIEKETKKRRKEEDGIFRSCGKISVFKRIFNFIWRTK